MGFLGAYGPDHALTRDLDAARALMAEAGYADGFEISLSYPVFTFQGGDMVAPVALKPGKWMILMEAHAKDGTLFRKRLDLFVKG